MWNMFRQLARLHSGMGARACSGMGAGPPLREMPPLSSRKQRIQKHGLLALSSEFVKQQAAPVKAAIESSFRIQQYTVPLNRPAEFALTAVYGYGRSRSRRLAQEVGVFGHFPLSRMRESQRAYIRRVVNQNCIAYDDPSSAAGPALRKEVGLNIQRLKQIRCYRGIRHELRLPSRGQQTKRNARTRKRMGPLN